MTPDETALLPLVALGYTNDELAAHFNVTTRTLCRWRSSNPALNRAVLAARERLMTEKRRGCGTHQSYRRGCRCQPCKNAHAHAQREWALQRRRDTRSPHAISRARVEIEQAIARGLSTSQIMATVGADYPTVLAARERLDVLAAESFDPRKVA